MESSSSNFTSESSDEELLNYMRNKRRKKIIKPRSRPAEDLKDDEFFDKFRLTKGTVHTILELIENSIKFSSLRNKCLSPMQQLLLTLRFYVTGCMLISVGDFIGVTKSTASRTVYRVSEAIARLRPQFIKFPQTQENVNKTQAGFYKIAKFPKVLATIDCTHIKIQSPGGNDAEIYRNRNGFFSYNVQTLCNHELKITNIVARWPGSTHDQTIFNNSRIKYQFDAGSYKDCFLLGDSGYGNNEYLLTPLLQTNDAAQTLYNTCHIKTRNTVERQHGVWKRRFPILSLGMRVSNELAKIIIVATAVLHNIAIEMNEPLPLDEDKNKDEDEDIGVDASEAYINDEGENNNNRNRLISNYFQLLI